MTMPHATHTFELDFGHEKQTFYSALVIPIAMHHKHLAHSCTYMHMLHRTKRFTSSATTAPSHFMPNIALHSLHCTVVPDGGLSLSLGMICTYTQISSIFCIFESGFAFYFRFSPIQFSQFYFTNSGNAVPEPFSILQAASSNLSGMECLNDTFIFNITVNSRL